MVARASVGNEVRIQRAEQRRAEREQIRVQRKDAAVLALFEDIGVQLGPAARNKIVRLFISKMRDAANQERENIARRIGQSDATSIQQILEIVKAGRDPTKELPPEGDLG